MKTNSQEDKDSEGDYVAQTGALDTWIRYEPNSEQLSEIKRKILHMEIDQLAKYVEEETLDISKVIVADDDRHTLIFYAIKIKNEENWLKMVKELIEKYGWLAKHTDIYDQTLLFYACRDGYTSLVEYLINEWKLNPDHRDKYQQTPMYYACRENKLPTLNLLLELNADINVVDSQGQTPLFYASKKGHIDICKALVDKGININHKDNKNTSAIQIAQKSNKYEIVNFLEEKGAEVPITWKNNKKMAKK